MIRENPYPFKTSGKCLGGNQFQKALRVYFRDQGCYAEKLDTAGCSVGEQSPLDRTSLEFVPLETK